MAVAEMNSDTLEALEQQAEEAGVEVTEPVDTTDTQDTQNTEDPVEQDAGDIELALEEPGEPDGGSTDSGDSTENSDSDVSDQNKEVDKMLSDAGFDVDEIAKRITEEGKIPEDVIAEAKEKLDPALVDAHVGRLEAEFELARVKASEEYIETQEKQKKVQEMNSYIFKAVGGEDKFKSLSSTLKSELSESELSSINAKLMSGNKSLVNEGLETAVAAYKKAKGLGGRIMEGDAGNTEPNALPHISKAEYRDVMKSEKYKTDPAYRNRMDAARLASRKADQKRYAPGTYYGVGPNGRYEL